jgi:putative aldouronate transport system substrate-binding protein
MITVMKAFVEKDPDGNGKNDTYGMTAGGNGANVVRDFPEFFKNGIIAGFYLDNGQFIDSGTDIRMGQALDDLKKSMDMKLYDPNWFLNKGDQVENAIVQGKVGIFLGTTREAALDNYAVSYQKKTKDVTGDQKADWQPFHPWANSGVFTEPLPGYPFLFSVKTPEAKVKRSTEILDWLSGEEGFLLTHYGLEGVHYKKSGNKIELIPDAIKKDIADNGNFLDIYGFFTPAEPQSLGLELVDPRETDRDRAILAKISSYKYLPSIGTSVSVKEGMDLASVRKQMNLYQSKILFEEKDASSWPKYREELMNKYGGKQIFEYYAEQITKAHGKTFTFKADN